MRTVGLLKNGKVAQVTSAAPTEKAKKPSGSKKDAAKGKAEKPTEQKPENPPTDEGNAGNSEQKDAAKGKAETDGNEDE